MSETQFRYLHLDRCSRPIHAHQWKLIIVKGTVTLCIEKTRSYTKLQSH